MELLEYQAKELFKMVGIPILPSQTIKDSRKIKQLQIPYPVVLKSQVRSGGRGKAGGVRFAANTIDAIAAARIIFNLSILNEYPEFILAEAHYNAEREFLLAIVLDYDLQRPVLLGSALGGMNVDSLLANLQQVVVESEFSIFYARRLAANMGLSGQLICSVSEIIAKMYRLFVEKDLDLIEINPLGVNSKGELMALDGKITINDHALARQPIVETLNFSQYQIQANQHNVVKFNQDFAQARWRWLDWQNSAGKIAIICNSFDLALLTWDLLEQNKVSPACGVLIAQSLSSTENNPKYQKQIAEILAELESVSGIKAILVNIWETEAVSREVIEAIANYAQSIAKSASSANEQPKAESDQANKPTSIKQTKSLTPVELDPQPQFILRLLNKDNLKDIKITETMYLSSNLEAAIAQAIAVVKSN